MTAIELQAFLKQRFPTENEHHEWKEWASLKSNISGRKGEDLVSYVSALANMDGGCVVIGARDGTLQITGIQDFADYTPENVIHRILGKTPNLPSQGLRVEALRASDTGAIVVVQALVQDILVFRFGDLRNGGGHDQVRLASGDQPHAPQQSGLLVGSSLLLLHPVQPDHLFDRQIGALHQHPAVVLVKLLAIYGQHDPERRGFFVVRQGQEALALLLKHLADAKPSRVDYYKRAIIQRLKLGPASGDQLRQLVIDKLPAVLTSKEKETKVKNLRTALRLRGLDGIFIEVAPSGPSRGSGAIWRIKV